MQAHGGATGNPDLSFGRWVQRRRKALDLTQAELAQRVGYARRHDPQGRNRPASSFAPDGTEAR